MDFNTDQHVRLGTVGTTRSGFDMADNLRADGKALKSVLSGESVKVSSPMDLEALKAKLGIEIEETRASVSQSRLSSALDALLSRIEIANAKQTETLRKLAELTDKGAGIQNEIKDLEEQLRLLELAIETEKLEAMAKAFEETPEEKAAKVKLKEERAKSRQKEIDELKRQIADKKSELLATENAIAETAKFLDDKSVAVFAAAIRITGGGEATVMSLIDDSLDDQKTTELEKFLEAIRGEDLLDILLEKTEVRV